MDLRSTSSTRVRDSCTSIASVVKKVLAVPSDGCPPLSAIRFKAGGRRRVPGGHHADDEGGDPGVEGAGDGVLGFGIGRRRPAASRRAARPAVARQQDVLGVGVGERLQITRRGEDRRRRGSSSPRRRRCQRELDRRCGVRRDVDLDARVHAARVIAAERREPPVHRRVVDDHPADRRREQRPLGVGAAPARCSSSRCCRRSSSSIGPPRSGCRGEPGPRRQNRACRRTALRRVRDQTIHSVRRRQTIRSFPRNRWRRPPRLPPIRRDDTGRATRRPNCRPNSPSNEPATLATETATASCRNNRTIRPTIGTMMPATPAGVHR